MRHRSIHFIDAHNHHCFDQFSFCPKPGCGWIRETQIAGRRMAKQNSGRTNCNRIVSTYLRRHGSD